MHGLQKMSSHETEPCNPDGNCCCVEVLINIRSWIIDMERRIYNADENMKTFPQYTEAIFQFMNREIVNLLADVQLPLAPIESYYANDINALIYRAMTIATKLNRNSEILQHCFDLALATQQYESPKGIIPIPSAIHCQCHCKPAVGVLQEYVLFLAKQVDCIEKNLLIYTDLTKTIYLPISNAQAEGQEELTSALTIGEAPENETENSVSKSLSDDEKNISECYPMDFKVRGRCIYFGHQIFNYKKLSERNIEREKQMIENTFTKMGFTFEPHIDLSYKQIKKTVISLTKENFENDDCICIIISTHGQSKDLLWAKDVCYPFAEIEDRIASIKSLINKPKIFFIEACRGGRVDQGIDINEVNTSSEDEVDQGFDINEVNYSSEDEVDGDKKSKKVSQKADIFKGYSCPPGFLSWRGWFLQEICKTFDKYSETADIETIVKITSREIRKKESKSFDVKKNKAKLVPYVEHTLDKKVYFKSKI